MRILFTRFPLESAHGGAENQTMWLAAGLKERGHEVGFLGSCPVLLQTFASAGFSTEKLVIGPPPVTKWCATSFLWRRGEMLQRLRRAMEAMPTLPDAVVMLSLSEKILLTDWLSTRGVKVFWVEHDRIGRWLTKNPWLSALRKASEHATIICVSELSRQKMVSLGFEPQRVLAIPNGVPVASSSPTYAEASAGRPDPFSHGPSSPDPFSRREKGGAGEKNAMNPNILAFARSMRKESTDSEKLLWEELRSRKLGVKFRRQHPIDSWILDFYCEECQLGIEIDGSVHDEEDHARYDAERTQRLSEFGIRIVRFKNVEVLTDLETVLSKIVHQIHSPSPFGRGVRGEGPQGGSGEGEGPHREVRMSSEGPHAEVGIKSEKNVLNIGIIARLSPEKGIDVLIHSLEKLPEVNLTIVGVGREEAYLRSLIVEDTHRMGIERIRIISHVSDTAVFYASLDAFVLPSSDHDPFGLVAAEAMMHGIATVVTDSCGIAGYLHNDKDALIAHAGSAQSMESALRKLLDPTYRDSIAKAGRMTATRHFSTDAMVDAYQSVLTNPR